MATTANLPPGAIPANGNSSDPFVTTPTHAHGHSSGLRYAQFDSNDQNSLYSTHSPSQTRRALEAHLKDTDRRIQDASRLGTTLLQQRKDLAARLTEVEQVQATQEVPAELRGKLAELEREYNEVGKESARAFLPKASRAPDATPGMLTGTGRESPTKGTVPVSSRRQRNQPNNRVHDIEFATEISTSLLAQVRSLQAALAEKDEALRETAAGRAQSDAEVTGLAQRIKHMDESERRYKDENWNLEMRLQELEANLKASTDKEQRLTHGLRSTEAEKAAAQRDLDDLKVTHEKLNDEHLLVKRQQESDLNGLRRDAVTHNTERQRLQDRVDELTAQNSELARAVSSRWNHAGATGTDTDFVSADEERQTSEGEMDPSAPASPVKGAQNHGVLESETLKSSLHHAHRMIQNLKNNIHREKTEKIELKRMLQEARDEVEARRGADVDGAALAAKKRRSDDVAGRVRGKPRPDRLGAARSSTTEIFDEQDWEDHDTPSKSRLLTPDAFAGAAVGGAAGVAAAAAYHSSTDAEAFETATERDGGMTTDAFETGRESLDDDSDQLTETENDHVQRAGTVVRKPSAAAFAASTPSSLASLRHHRNRNSFQSTASTTDGEEDGVDDRHADADLLVSTPVQSSAAGQPAKYRLRVTNRGSRRGLGRVGDLLIGESPTQFSPASSTGTPGGAVGGQTLGDELDGLDDESAEGTPATQRMLSPSPLAAPAHKDEAAVAEGEGDEREPEIGSPIPAPGHVRAGDEDWNLAHQANAAMLAHESAINKPTYADAGVMTEPWTPETPATIVAGEDKEGQKGLRQRAEEVVGGALAGFGLGRLTGKKREEDDEKPAEPDEESLIATSVAKEHLPEEADGMPVGTQTGQQVEEMKDGHHGLETAATAVPLAGAAALAGAAVERHEQNLAFSPMTMQETAPVHVAEDVLPPTPRTPMVPRRSSRRLDALYPDDEGLEGEEEDRGLDPIPGTDGARPGAAFLDVPDNSASKDSMVPITKPLQVKKSIAHEGSQTVVSGDDIEMMLRDKNKVLLVGAPGSVASGSPSRPNTAIGPNANGGRRSIDGVVGDTTPVRGPRRPASAGSMRTKAVGLPPPLPEDHTQKIAAAAQKAPSTPAPATAGTMGPPLMPASAYKGKRPATPAETGRRSSRDGTTPRAAHRGSRSSNMQSPSGLSRRTSVSSFASECDERFQLQHGQLIYPADVVPATDPRMIQAITQTMIGEYLWKYTRKAGRSETSSTRHRRFFWVHPYTRTLYWSEKDPSTAGKDMLKAKSVAIQAVRVITDDNAYPPGLHRKSLVIDTPGREIVFTAPTGQRHETWFNALSYLLLRSTREKHEANDSSITHEDLDEFHPGFGSSFRRSISRMTGRSRSSHSRVSLSSYNSRTTRNSSPPRSGVAAGIVGATPTLTRRPSASNQRSSRNSQQLLASQQLSEMSPTRDSSSGNKTTITAARRASQQPLDPADAYSSTRSRPGAGARHGSSGRFSSLSKFSGSNRGRTSFRSSGSAPGKGGRQTSEIYDAAVADESAEDIRKVMEQQERDAEGLENVRACCDGKHDVGALSSRSSRHNSLGNRLGSYSHTHVHQVPGTQARELAQAHPPSATSSSRV